LVQVSIVTPTDLTKTERQLLEEFARERQSRNSKKKGAKVKEVETN